MPFFNAAVGTKLLLEIEGNGKRFISFLVGYLKDNFILITTPSSEHLVSARPALYSNCKINVRYIVDGRAVGFQSRIIKTTEDPAKLLFLSYPKTVEDHELRKDKRSSCALPAELTINGAVCGAVIVDINQNGLRFNIKEFDEVSLNLGENPIGQECALHFFLPGGSVLQEVSGEIRNYERKAQLSAIGIQYVKISNETQQNIMEFESKLFA